MSSPKSLAPSVVIESPLKIFHSQSDMFQVTVLAKTGTRGRGRAGFGGKMGHLELEMLEQHQREVSSRWKCEEDVGLTDVCNRDVLVEATEVNEMIQTKTVERREEA